MRLPKYGESSLKSALLKCFEDEPNSIFGIQELCAKVQKYYTFTEFQMELDGITALRLIPY